MKSNQIAAEPDLGVIETKAKLPAGTIAETTPSARAIAEQTTKAFSDLESNPLEVAKNFSSYQISDPGVAKLVLLACIREERRSSEEQDDWPALSSTQSMTLPDELYTNGSGTDAEQEELIPKGLTNDRDHQPFVAEHLSNFVLESSIDRREVVMELLDFNPVNFKQTITAVLAAEQFSSAEVFSCCAEYAPVETLMHVSLFENLDVAQRSNLYFAAVAYDPQILLTRLGQDSEIPPAVRSELLAKCLLHSVDEHQLETESSFAVIINHLGFSSEQSSYKLQFAAKLICLQPEGRAIVGLVGQLEPNEVMRVLDLALSEQPEPLRLRQSLSESILRRAYSFLEIVDYDQVDNVTLAKVADQLPVLKILKPLSGLRQPSANGDHDPWRQELSPMFYEYFERERSELDPQTEEDSQIVYDFVKRFGMINAPELFDLHVRISKASGVEALTPETRQEVLSFIKPKELKRLRSTKQVLTALAASKDQLVKLFLSDTKSAVDQLKQLTANPALASVFKLSLGENHWERKRSVPDIIKRLSRSLDGQPELHECKPYEVSREIGLRKAGFTGHELKTLLDKEQYHSVIEAKTEICSIAQTAAVVAVNIFEILEAAGADEQGLDVCFEVALVATAMRYQPDGFTGLFKSGACSTSFETSSLEATDVWFRDYFFAHFIPEDPGSMHDYRSYTESVDKLRAAHTVISEAVSAYKAAGKQQPETGPTKAFTLLPSKKLGRVFAGDTGNACYTSEHNTFADGEYPGITAYTIVENLDSQRPKLAGSFLTVSTTSSEGEKVLVVRGNNPRENLQKTVNTDELIEKILGAAIETAIAGDYKFVAVPLSQVSRASSNRGFVADYYQTNFSNNRKLELIRNTDTTFNGYQIYNSKGIDPVVEIWSNPKYPTWA